MGYALAPFLIMLREGLEAALIIGIVASYLGQTGRRSWLPVMGVGICLALAAALTVGAALQWLAADFPQRQQELFEALVGLVAVAMLTYMVFWMSRSARGLGTRLRGAVDQALAGIDTGTDSHTHSDANPAPHGIQHADHGAWGLVAMVFLAVAREGLESVFFLLAVFEQRPGWSAPAGALAGLALAALLGLMIYRFGVRLNLRRFFGVTAVLILFVAAGLLAGSLRKLHEAGLWNIGQQVVVDWSQALPMDSIAGTVLSGLLGYQATPVLSEVLLYGVFLLLCGGALWWRGRRPLPMPQPVGRVVDGVNNEGAHRPARMVLPARDLRLWRGLLGLSALLVVLALYLFAMASGRRDPALAAAADQEVTVRIQDGRCDPADIRVPAGRTRFVIVNRSARTLEWEILDGVMVVDERENIAPGMTQSLRVQLQPGDYEITCGLLGSPRGRLQVLPSAQSRDRAQAPQMVDFIGALAEFRVYSLLRWQDADDALATLRAQTQAPSLEPAAADATEVTRAALQQLARASGALAALAPAPDLLWDLQQAVAALAPVTDAQGPRARPLDPALVNRLTTAVAALEPALRAQALTPSQLLQAVAEPWRAGADADGDPEVGADARWLLQERRQGERDATSQLLQLFEPVLAAAQPALLAQAQRALQDEAGGDARAPVADALAQLAAALASLPAQPVH